MDGSRRPVAVFAMRAEVREQAFPDDLLARLRRSVVIDAEPLAALDTPAARRALADTEILVTGWGCPPIDADVLAAAPRLVAVIHAAGTVKQLVTDACWARGLAVSSAAAANALPVAEYTLAVCVLAAKRGFRLARGYADGEPVYGFESGAVGLTGATVGVVGASRVGRLVIGLLRGHGARVLVHDPFLSPAEAAALGAQQVELDVLCQGSHIVSVHAPETPSTYRLIDDRRMALMAEGTVLVNTARGSLVDTEALTRHCATGPIEAVLDVTEPEPLPPGHPLRAPPNVVLTPHIAGAQGREVRRLGAFAVAEIERYLVGEPLAGGVRAADLARLA